MTRLPIRYEDYTLDDTQQALRDAARQFFEKESPASVVRAAAARTGYDDALWRSFAQIGGSLVDDDDEGATLVDLALVVEEVGRAVAPLPFVSDVVGRRLVSRARGKCHPEPLTVALEPAQPGVPQLVPDVAAARSVVALVGDALELHDVDAAHPVPNQGSTPLGWWTPGAARVTLSSGVAADEQHVRARREWKLLTAAALVGLTDAALALAVTAVTDRHTLGVPLGALQGVAFPLADVAVGVASARHLVWRAAWFEEHEPASRPDLVPLAYAWACRTATEGTTAAAHFHGGLGFTVEADVTLYFLRAKGWSLAGGDPARDLVEVGTWLVERA